MWTKLDCFSVSIECELIVKGNDSQAPLGNIHCRKDVDKYLKQLYQDIFSHSNVERNNRRDMKKGLKRMVWGKKSYREQ